MSAPAQAAILVGGKGTRLGALTADTPKPMLHVGGRPMLEHLIAVLVAQGVSRVLLLAGHLGEQLEALAADGARLGCAIDCVVEPAPAGTGGALHFAAERLEPEFLLLNGDSFFDADLADLSALGRDLPGGLGALALRAVPDASRYGSVAVHGARIIGFEEKQPGAGLINGGVYWLRREVVARMPPPPASIERDLFPALAAEGLLAGRAYDGYFIDIGVPDDFVRAQTELPVAVTAKGRPPPS